MDLQKQGAILYVSSVDVSQGNGPGVNEREFILGLYEAIGERAHFLIPRPEEAVVELPLHACTFSLPHRRRSPRYWPGHVGSQVRLASRLLSQRRFDLLLFRLDVLPLAPLYITRKYPVPYAIRHLAQTLLWSLTERGGRIGRSLEGINRFLLRQVVSKALVSDTPSRIQVAYLKQALNIDDDKIVWIDNAVNTKRFSPVGSADARQRAGLAHFDPIVGYVGTRPWERGASQLVEILPRLLPKYPSLGVVVLGDGAGLAALKQRAVALQVDGHCVFTGSVPFDRVPEYIGALDVGVSLNLRPDRRGAAELKVRQYLACGKPVVISTGSNEFVSSEGLGAVVQATDLDAIAAAVDRWLSLTPDERRRFAARAAAYMRANLSLEASIVKRLDLWTNRLQLFT